MKVNYDRIDTNLRRRCEACARKMWGAPTTSFKNIWSDKTPGERARIEPSWNQPKPLLYAGHRLGKNLTSGSCLGVLGEGVEFIVTDFDDTLTKKNRALDTQAIDALRQVGKEKPVALVSGRPLREANLIAELIGTPPIRYIGCHNGACICNMENRRLILGPPVDDVAPVLRRYYGGEAEILYAGNGCPLEVTIPTATATAENVHKVLDKHDLRGVFVESGSRYVHITRSNKGTAFLRICALLGVDPGMAAGFGDGENDRPFLSKAGVAVAVETDGYGHLEDCVHLVVRGFELSLLLSCMFLSNAGKLDDA